MSVTACRLCIVFLATSSALCTSMAQAFFCFSMNGGSGHREDRFVPPLPYRSSGYVGLPSIYYTSPMPPLQPVAPLETSNPDYPTEDPPVAPVEIRNIDYPLEDRSPPRQHIFR